MKRLNKKLYYSELLTEKKTVEINNYCNEFKNSKNYNVKTKNFKNSKGTIGKRRKI